MSTLPFRPGNGRRGPGRLAVASVAMAVILFATAACANPPAPPGTGGGPTEEPLAELELEHPGRGKATLTCTPDGGTHPDPTAACNALRKVGGDFEKLTWTWPSDMACIQIYDPVWARATGRWQSSPEGPTHDVDHTKEFSNSCFATWYSNVVFDF